MQDDQIQTIVREEASHPESRAFEGASRLLTLGERIVFTVVGLLLFTAALALAWRSIESLLALFGRGSVPLIDSAAHFLDVILLILMIAEIGYTVSLSLRGRVLTAQPFLIVGLIAVIRRILVITVQEVQPTDASFAWVTKSTVDLAILTLVVMSFVTAIVMLRKRPESES